MTEAKSLPFAALSVPEARQLIKEVVAEEIAAREPKVPVRDKPDAMGVTDAAALLVEYGYPITPKSIYNLVSSKAIPHKKVGRRIVFSRERLLAWLEQKTKHDAEIVSPALTLARNARKKL